MKTVLFAIFLTIAVSAPAQPGQSLFNRIDSIVTAGMRDVFPSISLAVVIDGKLVYFKAYGYADRAKKIPAATSTIYQIGSLTKTFTGNLFAKLVLQGKVFLFDSLMNYFPATVTLPKDSNGRNFTFFNLLTHTAGIPRYPPNLERNDGEPIRGFSREQLYEGIRSMELTNRIGARWNYSNFGYGIIGTALENLAGASLDSLFSREIFLPLGMNSSSLSLTAQLEKRLATPYRDDDPNKATSPWDMGAMKAAGNIFSNVEDLAKFMIYQINEEDAATKMQHQVYYSIAENVGYGLGCFSGFSKSKNTRIVYHGGDVDGYASDMNILPDRKMGVVMLTNCGIGREFSQISTAVFNAVFDYINRAGK